jgi:hypothetical protein
MISQQSIDIDRKLPGDKTQDLEVTCRDLIWACTPAQWAGKHFLHVAMASVSLLVHTHRAVTLTQ